jgi:hypothetical protein
MIIGLLLLLIGTGLVFLATSLRVVPTDPPSAALVTCMGRRTKNFKMEGVQLFPLASLGLYDGLVFRLVKVNQDLTQRMRTGADRAEMHARVIATWQPDPKQLTKFHEHGGEERMKTIVEGKVLECLRQWASSSQKNWKSVLEMNHDVTVFLIRNIAELPEGKSDLIGQVNHGVGDLSIPSLGIILNRLSVPTIDPGRKLAETADLEVAEEQVMAAENLRTGQFVQHLKTLTTVGGLSMEQAKELLEMERGFAQKKIMDWRGMGLMTPAQLAAVQNVLNT